MLNFPYMKQTVKSGLGLWGLFTAVLCLFLIVMTNVFTPANIEGLTDMAAATIASNLIGGTTLISFMANSYYAIMAIIFPMLYSIITGNSLIAGKVDNGSMAGYLATPVSRRKIVCSSAVCYVGMLVLMWGVVSAVGIAAAHFAQPGELDIETFLLMNLGAFLYHFAVGSICFCASCIFNSSTLSLLVGGGIPLFFFIVGLLVKLSDSLDWMRYLTLNTLFDTGAVLAGEGYLWDFIILAAGGLALFVIGIEVFKRKSLPL